MTFYLSKKVTFLGEKTNEIFVSIDDDKHNEANRILFTETPFVASESESSEEDDVEQIVKANLIAKSLLSPAPDQRLGEWERYTKVSILHSYFLFILQSFFIL